MASKMAKLYGEIENHALRIEHLNDKIAFLSSACEGLEDEDIVANVNGESWLACCAGYKRRILRRQVDDRNPQC